MFPRERLVELVVAAIKTPEHSADYNYTRTQLHHCITTTRHWRDNPKSENRKNDFLSKFHEFQNLHHQTESFRCIRFEFRIDGAPKALKQIEKCQFLKIFTQLRSYARPWGGPHFPNELSKTPRVPPGLHIYTRLAPHTTSAKTN